MERGVIKIVSYIRESTREQGYGFRPAAQRSNIKEYCKKHNFEDIKEFEDFGSGGDTKKRPRFIEMIQFVKRNKDIRFIVIAETSRFFRNLVETLNFEKELEEEYGIFAIDTWVDHDPRSYLQDGISPSQWAARMSARVRAEEARRYIQEVVTEGYNKKSSSGMYVGTVAFGLEWKDEHKKFIGYHPTESPMVKEIFKLYLTGQFGFTKLARHLNDKGFSRTEIERKEAIVGGGRVFKRYEVKKPFTLEAVRTFLSNKSYIGIQNYPPHLPLLTLDDNKMPRNLTPLIPEDDFNRVQEMIKQNTRGGSSTGHKKTSRQKRVFLLQGIAHSAVNGAKLHGVTDVAGQKTPCRRYMPSTNKSGSYEHIPSMRADEVEEKIIELMRFIKIRDLHEIEKILREVVEASAGHKKPGSISVINNLTDAIKALEKLQKTSYSHTNEVSIQNLTKDLAAHKDKVPTTQEMKYYDFIELKNVLSDVTGSFERLQSLAAKQELIEILFSQLFIGEEPMIGVKPLMPPAAYAHTTQSPEVLEAKELKALIQKFVPYLFEKIYVKQEMDILRVSFKPTGLFLLLNDSENQEKGIADSLPHAGPSAPSGGDLGGNYLKSIPGNFDQDWFRKEILALKFRWHKSDFALK